MKICKSIFLRLEFIYAYMYVCQLSQQLTDSALTDFSDGVLSLQQARLGLVASHRQRPGAGARYDHVELPRRSAHRVDTERRHFAHLSVEQTEP